MARLRPKPVSYINSRHYVLSLAITTINNNIPLFSIDNDDSYRTLDVPSGSFERQVRASGFVASYFIVY